MTTLFACMSARSTPVTYSSEIESYTASLCADEHDRQVSIRVLEPVDDTHALGLVHLARE